MGIKEVIVPEQINSKQNTRIIKGYIHDILANQPVPISKGRVGKA